MKTLIRFGRSVNKVWTTDKSKDIIVDDFVLRNSVCVNDTIHEIMEISSLIGHEFAQTIVVVAETPVVDDAGKIKKMISGLRKVATQLEIGSDCMAAEIVDEAADYIELLCGAILPPRES